MACESDTPASAGASTTGSTASIVGVLGSSEHANGEQQQPPTGSLSPVDKRASCRNARSHDDDNAMSISLTKDTPPGHFSFVFCFKLAYFLCFFIGTYLGHEKVSCLIRGFFVCWDFPRCTKDSAGLFL